MIDKYTKPLGKPDIYLCKPNKTRTTIANLPEAYKVKRTVSRGNINELEFTLPLFVQGDSIADRVKNKHLDILRERYIIRFEHGDEKEYYIVDKKSKVMDDSDYVVINCYGLGLQLNNHSVKDYSVVSYTLSQIARDLLKNTGWTLGYVDAQFDLKYRTFDHSGGILEGMNRIAEQFVALIVWDTANRTINFYDPDNYGVNKGFVTKMGKLMKSVQYELNLDEMCTRLKLFGKDGMSIQAVNPTGSNYIEDYSYFMYPFEQDAQGNVVKHSYYMEDDLCIALKRYRALIEEKSTTFNALLSQVNGLYATLGTKNNELSTFKNELIIIEDNLATYNATQKNDPPIPNTSFINQKNSKQAQISAKESEITSLKTQIANIELSINEFSKLLAIESNLTADQLEVLNTNFIFIKEFSDENFTKPEDLLEEGKKQFDKIREPKIITQLSIVNFYEIMTEQHNVGRLSCGDIVTIEHEELGINVKAHVSDIVFDYEASSIDITVSNAQDLLTDEERFLKDHMKSVGASNTLSTSALKWNQAKATTDEVSQLLNTTWNAVQRNINAGVNEDVEISRRGIIIKDPGDPLKMIIFQHSQLALTNDGGNTWQTAVTSEGIFAQRLVGKILLGNKLVISDDDGSFTIEGDLLTVRDATGKIRVQLGQYESGKYGLKIVSKKGNVVLDENGILQTDTIQLADNVDSTHPLKLKFYISPNVLRIDEVQLNFSAEAFRAYSKGAASTMINLNTTAYEKINLTTTKNGGGRRTTAEDSDANLEGTTLTDSYYTTGTGHNHGWASGLQFKDVNGVTRTWSSSGGHQHRVSLIPHSHEIVLPEHNHAIEMPEHSHRIEMPSHSHDIEYGIYEGAYASNIRIIIDGAQRGSQYYGTNNVDVTPWITTPGWHTIELTSNGLGRINASLYMRTFLGA
ncbi:phage tail spike protein [Saccharibacillus deserti]|uniref:phage tail spike protein n=1 Tax=Saccharibacillus deserti TaxID=1634444 RepID=UPI001552DDE6|nr:phage tail spike protein [Saccharibacillus deserti]